MYRKVLFLTIIKGLFIIGCWCILCHDDPLFEPEEGPLTELQFSWLGALQYIHVKQGTPHYFRVPRVVLVAKQFVLSTAKDAAEIPPGYALGNVVFTDYERDESECQVTNRQMADGDCAPSVLLMPISDVLLHPEYKHFGIKTSVALLKLLTPIKSRYMLPACLPFNNFLRQGGIEMYLYLIHLDFVSDVPRDFVEEEKEVIHVLRVHTKKCMFKHSYPPNSTLPMGRYMCTTGCDLQSGSPNLVHEETGHWTIVSLSENTVPCPDPLRSSGHSNPSRHLLIHPYVPWITTAIVGARPGSNVNSKDDPFGYPERRTQDVQVGGGWRAKGWVGRWWVGGYACYERGDNIANKFRFYHEVFDIYPDLYNKKNILYYLEIHCGHDVNIICVKVGMPYQMVNPMIWGLNTPIAKLRIPIFPVNKMYRIFIEAWSDNGTISQAESVEEEAEEAVISDSDVYGEAREDYYGYDELLGKIDKPRPKWRVPQFKPKWQPQTTPKLFLTGRKNT